MMQPVHEDPGLLICTKPIESWNCNKQSVQSSDVPRRRRASNPWTVDEVPPPPSPQGMPSFLFNMHHDMVSKQKFKNQFRSEEEEEKNDREYKEEEEERFLISYWKFPRFFLWRDTSQGNFA